MKIALILPLNVWAAPYASIYTYILNKLKINYDIIYWNRDLSEPNKDFAGAAEIFQKVENRVPQAAETLKILSENKLIKLVG